MTAGTVPLRGDRETPFVREIEVRGLDLTGAALRMMVRREFGTPGAPLIDLQPAAANAEGLSITTNLAGPVPVSTIQVRINQATMQDPTKVLPANEVGADVTLAWDMHLTRPGRDKRVFLRGPLIVQPGATR